MKPYALQKKGGSWNAKGNMLTSLIAALTLSRWWGVTGEPATGLLRIVNDLQLSEEGWRQTGGDDKEMGVGSFSSNMSQERR